MSEVKSSLVDLDNPNANMYGCQPCPKCKSCYRYERSDGIIECGDCDYEEKAIHKGDESGE